jgi:hypothetical protein
MALTDHFGEANLLDSVMWAGMTLDARIAKLSNLYIKNEDKIRRAHRNYKGPTPGTIKVFVKSYCSLPRGTAQDTYKRIMATIPVQRKIIEERQQHQPWTFTKKKVKDRMQSLSRRRYTIWSVSWNRKKEKQMNNPVEMGQVSDVRLIIDGGSYNHHARAWMRHLPTGRVKIVVLKNEDRSESITSFLSALAPVEALRGMFSGEPIKLDFDGEGFWVKGKLIPWRNVGKVYKQDKQGLKPIVTDGHPPKG